MSDQNLLNELHEERVRAITRRHFLGKATKSFGAAALAGTVQAKASVISKAMGLVERTQSE